MQEYNSQFRRIIKKLNDIDDKLEKPKSFDDYVSELEAKKLLGRGTTWFWERRRSGELPYTKLGGQVFYLMKDLIKYLEERSSED
ncbi:MAG: helix-turn-helix domain-containing protein [Woeseiaceae bacterium]|nr:helix-turn-helix domain-containing protein [Woeseiaceae bacterium]